MASFKEAKDRLKVKDDEISTMQLSLSDEKLKSVQHQIKNLFASRRNPGKLLDWSKTKDGIVGTKFEEPLQDLIARGYGLYTIVSEMKKLFGDYDVLRSRNILGYIKREVLNKAENLQLIAQLSRNYKLDRTDTHELLEKEALDRRKELDDEETQIKKDIDQLYARIAILKNENKGGFFSSAVESQIARNLEVIDSFRQRLRIVQAEKQGFLVDIEEMRAKILEAIVGICLKNMLPKIPKEDREDVKISLKQEIQAWINTETRLNKLEEFKQSLMPGKNKKTPPTVIDQRRIKS